VPEIPNRSCPESDVCGCQRQRPVHCQLSVAHHCKPLLVPILLSLIGFPPSGSPLKNEFPTRTLTEFGSRAAASLVQLSTTRRTTSTRLEAETSLMTFKGGVVDAPGVVTRFPHFAFRRTASQVAIEYAVVADCGGIKEADVLRVVCAAHAGHRSQQRYRKDKQRGDVPEQTQSFHTKASILSFLLGLW